MNARRGVESKVNKLLVSLDSSVETQRRVGEGDEEGGGAKRMRRRRRKKCGSGLQQQPPPACWPPWLPVSVELVVGCWGPILIPLACNAQKQKGENGEFEKKHLLFTGGHIQINIYIHNILCEDLALTIRRIKTLSVE